MQVTQLTGFSDPVYAEAYININQYDIVLSNCFVFFLPMQVTQLTGFSDPVYAEAYININQYDIVWFSLAQSVRSRTINLFN